MQDEFHAGVKRASKTIAKRRAEIDEIKKQTDRNPELWATLIVEVVPVCLREIQVVAHKEFGIYLFDAEAIRNYEASSVVEWQIISRLATCYQLYSAFWRLVWRYFQDPNLVGVQSAQAVCEAYVEASKQYLYAAALDFYELQQQLPEERFPNEELAKVLGGIVTARPRLSGELWDRKELRERLAEGGEKPYKQLMIDAPAEALDLFYEMMQADGIELSFEDLSVEVRRRIRRLGAKESVAERRLGEINELNEPEDESSSPEQVLEPAFASALLHELMNKADLSGQERESFLALGEMTSPEAAEKYGRSAVQVRQENLRALKKLRLVAGL